MAAAAVAEVEDPVADSGATEFSKKLKQNAAPYEEEEDEEEEEECRVCRGPAEEGRPLFSPCRCSGSIALVHQDCLTSWLAVTRGLEKGRCELCSTLFQFRPQYAEGAPERLPLRDVLYGIVRRAAMNWLPFAMRVIFALSLWLCLLPLLTAYLYHGWMHRPYAIFNRWKWELIAGDAVSGAVVAAVIIVSVLSLMSLADFLRVHWEQADREGLEAIRVQPLGEQQPPPPGLQQQQQQRQPERPLQRQWRQQQRRAAEGPEEMADGPEPPLEQARPANANVEDDRQDEFRVRAVDRNVVGVMDERQMVFQQPERERAEGPPLPPLHGVAVPPLRNNLGGGDVNLDDPELDVPRMLWNEERIDGGAGGLQRQRQRDGVQRQALAAQGLGNDDAFDMGEDRDGDHWPDDDDVDVDLPLAAIARGPAQHQPHAGEARREHGANAPRNLGRDPDDLDLDDPLQDDRDVNEAADRFEPQFEPLDPLAADAEAAGDMDIQVALDELLGLRGPISAVIRNVLWLLMFNAFYLFVFAFIPKVAGICMSWTFTAVVSISTQDQMDGNETSLNVTLEVNETAETNTTEALVVSMVRLLNTESERINTTFQLADIAVVALGYLGASILVFVLQRCAVLVKGHLEKAVARDLQRDEANRPEGEGNRHQAAVVPEGNHRRDFAGVVMDDDDDEDNDGAEGDEEFEEGDLWLLALKKVLLLIDCAAAVVKVGFLLFLKMLLLPLFLGIWLDAATLRLFGATTEDRILHAGRDLFSSVLLHWVVGITFMLLVTVSVLQLREVMHPDILARVIRPQEPQPDLIGNLLQDDGATHAKRMLLSLGIYTMLLSLYVWLPAFLLEYAGVGSYVPFFHPKLCHVVMPQLQVPIELLIFHLSMLAVLEKYKNRIGELLHLWLVYICNILGLSDHLLPKEIEKYVLVGYRRLHAVQEHETSDERTRASQEDNGTDATSSSSSETDDKQDDRHSDDEVMQGAISRKFWEDLLKTAKHGGSIDEIVYDNVEPVSSKLFLEWNLPPEGQRQLVDAGSFVDLSPHGNRDHAQSTDTEDVRTLLDSNLVPTELGLYRLRKSHRRASVDSDEETRQSGMFIVEFWREVAGKPIPRPPEGWDDLGVGGAEIQGRWAWGSERKSEVEKMVAKRKRCLPRITVGTCSRGLWWIHFGKIVVKSSILLFLSWAGIVLLICVGLSLPLVTGRLVFFLLRIPDRYIHDPLAFPFGAAIAIPLVRVMWEGPFSLLRRLYRWVTSFRSPPSSRKLGVVLWALCHVIVFAPLFLGLTYELNLVRSGTWWVGEEDWSLSSLVLSWATGLTALFVWGSLCYVAAFRLQFWADVGLFILEDDARVADVVGRPGQNDRGEENNGAVRPGLNNLAVLPEEDDAEPEGDENFDDSDDEDDQDVGVGPIQNDVAVRIVGNVRPNEGRFHRNLPWQGDGGRIQRFVDIVTAVICRWEWDKVDGEALIRDCAAPITRRLAVAFLCPTAAYFCCRLACDAVMASIVVAGVVSENPVIWGDLSGFQKMLIFRFFGALTILIQLIADFRAPLSRWFEAAHKAVRDDRYLIGEVLMNYVAKSSSRR